jgi:hypothetical protein
VIITDSFGTMMAVSDRKRTNNPKANVLALKNHTFMGFQSRGKATAKEALLDEET